MSQSSNHFLPLVNLWTQVRSWCSSVKGVLSPHYTFLAEMSSLRYKVSESLAMNPMVPSQPSKCDNRPSFLIWSCLLNTSPLLGFRIGSMGLWISLSTLLTPFSGGRRRKGARKIEKSQCPLWKAKDYERLWLESVF